MTSTSSETSNTLGLISSSTFSSSSFPSLSVSTISISSQSSDNDDDLPTISRSSSLLFGFLITFLALFIGFMACGYSSRRASQIRAARNTAQLRETESYASAKMKKPRLWDVWVDKGSGKDQWKSIKPLSASVVRSAREARRPVQPTEVIPSTPPALLGDAPPQEYQPSFYLGSRVFGRLRFPASSTPPTPPSRSPSPATRATIISRGLTHLVQTESRLATIMHMPPSELSSIRRIRAIQNRIVERSRKNVDWDTKDVDAQISVLIAMPIPTSSTRGEITEGCKEGPPYCEIGVATVPVSRPTRQTDEQQQQ